MKSVYAYFGEDKSKKLVYFGKEIILANADTQISDQARLEKQYHKEKALDASVVAIARFKNCDLTFFDNSKFRGIVYSSRARLQGSWKVV